MKLSPRYFLLALVCLLVAASGQAQTYSSDPNITDFTNGITSYATFTNYSLNQGCTAAPFTPSAGELATTGCRVYAGSLVGTGTGVGGNGLPSGNNWIEASFPEPVSTIVVFPNIDHFGDPTGFDGYQYQIAGSNDGVNWTVLFDVSSATACSAGCIPGGNGEPFILGTFTGTKLTNINVNNVLSNYPTNGLPSGCAIGVNGATPNVTPPYDPSKCTIGYIAQFTFGTAYQYYAFGASTLASIAGNTDQELSAVGTTQQVTGRPTALSIPTSGALLTIIGHLADKTPVNIYRYDGQIHSGVVQAVPVGTDLSNCNLTDATYPTDAYVLQGGSWTGCDAGDGFEVTDNNNIPGTQQAVGTADIGADNTATAFGSGFHVETHYSSTGYVTVTNNTGQTFTGAITLSGNPVIPGAPNCPSMASYPVFMTPPVTQGGALLANSGTLLAPAILPATAGSNVATLSMGGDSSACGGFSAPQIALMQDGVTFQYNIGKDYVQVRPLDSLSNRNGNPAKYLKVLPIPVPAGPLGNPPAFGTFGPFGGSPVLFSSGEFGQETPVLPTSPFLATNYAALACVPIASFSANNRDAHSLPIAGATRNPVCPELELDCVLMDGISPCGGAVKFGGLDQFLWNGFFGFTVDPIVGAGIGGVHLLAQHNTAAYPGTCPTNGFNTDAVVYYIGDPPGIDYPMKGQSCFVATYEPGTAPTPNNVLAYAFFNGFLPGNVTNCPTAVPPAPQPACTPQPVKSGSSISLKWLSQTTAGTPITTLQQCNDPSPPSPPTCGTGTPAPWVWMGFSQISCGNGALNGAIMDDVSGASGLQNLGPAPNGNGSAPAGTYLFSWKTSKQLNPPGSCATPVMIFSGGTIAFDYAEFIFQ